MQLKGSPEKRDAWVRNHGVEKVFGFPSTEVAPVKLAPVRTTRAKKVRAKARAKAAPARSETDWKKPLPHRHRLPDVARPTLDLHVFYWTEVWSMNSYALYTRYKKHLPAADRRLVDELCNASAMGHTKEIPSRVEYIVQKTWQAEDGAAFIRSPKLDDEGADDEMLRRWREMTGRG